MKRIFLTGSTGFLGSHLLKDVPTDVKLYCGLRTSSNAPGIHNILLELKDSDLIPETLDRINPDIVIHVAAISSEAACVRDPHIAYQVNVGSVLAMQQWCQHNNRRFIFTSTDLIFDGRKGNYSEVDVARPTMAYGCLKAEAESLVRQVDDHLILRLPLLFGIGYGDRKGGLYQFMRSVSDGQSIYLFEDEFRTPVYVKDVAEFIWKIADADITGTFHLGGHERISRLELGQLFVSHLNLDDAHLIPVSRADKGMNNRPEDTSLDSRSAMRLGFRPTSIQDALVETYRLLKAGLFLDSPL